MLERHADRETTDKIRAARSRGGERHGDYRIAARSVPELIAKRAGERPQQPFLVYFDAEGRRSEWTYAAFHERVGVAAGRLAREMGIRRGDRMATLMFNHPETVLFYFGALSLGATVVPINVEESDDRVRQTLEQSGAKGMVARVEVFEKAKACAGARPILRSEGEGKGTGPVAAADPAVGPDDEALLVYTSGTTGIPKGVVLTHYNLLADARAIAEWHRIAPGDRMMCVLPIHHVNGTVVTLMTPLHAGGTVVLNRRFSAGGFWRRAGEEKVGIVSVVPTLLHFLLEKGEDPGPARSAGFRHFICGAGPLTVDLASRFEDRFGFRIVHGYGLSETTCYSCFLPVDLADGAHRRWMRDLGFPSIGVPIETNEMAIHDEGGRALEPGKRGEIVIRGHNVMVAYDRNPEANAKTFAHGWFRSGDEGFLERGEDGRPYFFITGRIKELIARGGVKFSPLEIDEVLNRVPGVRRGIAVGFENDAYGEEVGAVIEVEEGASVTEEEVVRACASLPYMKRPKVVRFSRDLPFTSTGKIQRGKLRPLFAEFRSTQFREGKP
ncbi:MAG TPA: class I adenylate-forming enzyme family protein [Planctomycetota bacterium]|nr:class I adenylate-forming enzyme family protein [Planctomycetota bacterium]